MELKFVKDVAKLFICSRREKLESIQYTATKFVLPNIDSYEQRLDVFVIPKVANFLMSIHSACYGKILNYSSHPFIVK